MEIPTSDSTHLQSPASGPTWSEHSFSHRFFPFWFQGQQCVSATEHSLEICMYGKPSQWSCPAAEHSLYSHQTRKYGQALLKQAKPEQEASQHPIQLLGKTERGVPSQMCRYQCKDTRILKNQVNMTHHQRN